VHAEICFCRNHGAVEKIDTNRNNALDAGAEFRAFRRLEKLDGSVPLTPSQEAYIGGLQADLASMGSIPFANLAKEEEQEASGCARLEGVYLRHDKLDMSIIREDIKAAKGASISYTAAVLARNPCVPRPAGRGRGRPYVSGYSFAVSVEAVGLRVNDAGLTDLTPDTDYFWLGGTARLNVLFCRSSCTIA
jgi:hypothetical protein